jgi:acetyl-CoA carboxylase biotin carboxyl carrier protein
VKSLAAVMQESNVTELDVDLGQVVVRLRRPTREIGLESVPPRLSGDGVVEPPSREHVIAAPMIGTFYSAPTPGAPPVVVEGDDILAGQTIGIIEAMKIMNEISADRSGIVEAVLVENGQPVEYGSPLVRLAIGGSDRP